MFDVEVIDSSATAEVMLDPVRTRLLAELAEPSSATTLAARVGLTRQKVNYHLRMLESHGLTTLVEERRKGNCIERVLQATASSYVISPDALAAVAPDPGNSADRLSARWLVALAARMVQDVSALINKAAKSGKPLATFGLEGNVRFASAAARAEFTEALTAAVTDLIGKYHDETAAGGRHHHVIFAIHPAISRQIGHDATKDA
jgi:DNA-binding transcriptional ArsR family regulator